MGDFLDAVGGIIMLTIVIGLIFLAMGSVVFFADGARTHVDWHRTAVQHGCAHYEMDPATGRSTFHWNDEEAQP